MHRRRPRLRPGRRPRRWLALIAWCVLAGALVAAGAPAALAAAVAVPFVLVAPGAALVLLLRLHDPATGVTVVLLTGIAVGVLVPSILLYAGAWSPPAAFGIVAGATFAASILGMVREDDPEAP